MYQFFSGAIMMACIVAGIFFFRFWKTTQDRFFAIFGTAFLFLGLERLVLGLANASQEDLVYVYLVRLLAFSLIIYAIFDKNRGNGESTSG